MKQEDNPAVQRHSVADNREPGAKAWIRTVAYRLGSLELTTIILVYLFVLVFHGTLYQLDHSIQETVARYFDAWWIFLGPVPLPAGQLVFAAAGVNLLVATLTRIPWRWDQAGMFLVHGGLLLLIVGGMAGRAAYRESVVALKEGESTQYSYDLLQWDLVVSDASDEVLERHPLEDLPEEVAGFELEVLRYLPNAVVRQIGPGDVEHVEGAQRIERPEARREEHIPGLLANIDGRTILLHGGDSRALPLREDGDSRPFPLTGDRNQPADRNLRLLPRRYELPATLRLREFDAQFHEGTAVPRSFRSEVEVVQDGIARTATISMNDPIRIGEFTVYQSGYDSENGVNNVSLLQVVRNPFPELPYIVGLLVSAGLLLHAGVKLMPSKDRRVR